MMKKPFSFILVSFGLRLVRRPLKTALFCLKSINPLSVQKKFGIRNA